MQGFGYAPKRLYRYGKALSEDDVGCAVETFEREVKSRWMNIIPNTSMRSKQEFGITEDVTYLIIINDCNSYKIGDRIGDEENVLYEVISVQNFMTNQQLTVRECKTTE